MQHFNLELLSDNESSIAGSQIEIMSRARTFRFKYQSSHGPITDPKLVPLFENLDTARYWDPLGLVDGSNPIGGFRGGLTQIKTPTPKEREENRVWARERFTHEELQELFTLILNQALLSPLETGKPGTDMGHAILLRELVEWYKKSKVKNIEG